MSKETEIELCEMENRNLRTALARVMQKLSKKEKDELEKELRNSLEEGGVTYAGAQEELQDAAELLAKIVAHCEPLLLDPPGPSTKQPFWFAKLDALLSQARAYEPKHPVIRRVGSYPNVFSLVKKPV